MSELGTIITRGKGMRSLKDYFELLDSTLPRKLPESTRDWTEATYEAPHGFLWVWSDGTWATSFALASVVADIERIKGVTVSIEQ